MMKKRKAKGIATKRYRNKEAINLFMEEKENYDSDIIDDDTDLDQANDENLLPADYNNY